MEFTEKDVKKLLYFFYNMHCRADYVRQWLKLGIICPRASSLIYASLDNAEKILYNWSFNGVSKMTRTILKKFTNKEQWDSYWRKVMKLEGNIKFGTT